jgi:hypothetical protein
MRVYPRGRLEEEDAHDSSATETATEDHDEEEPTTLVRQERTRSLRKLGDRLALREGRPWLAATEHAYEGEYKSFCNLCSVELRLDRFTVERHAKTASHVRATNLSVSSQTMTAFFPSSSNGSQALSIILQSALLSGINPSQLDKFLTPQAISAIKSLEKPPTKTLISNTLTLVRQSQRSALVPELELDELPFSIQFDETKDHKGVSIINTLVSNMEGCWILDSSVLEDQKSKTIEDHVSSLLQDLKLPVEQLVSMPTDNCAAALAGARALCAKSTMGIGVRCFSHGLNLVLMHFSKELQLSMKLIRKLSSYLHGSGQVSGRRARAAEMDIKVASLRFAATRWNSRVTVGLSIRSQWDVLVAYLKHEKDIETSTSQPARKLLKLMKSVTVKIQLVLLTSLKPFVKIIDASQGRWRSNVAPHHVASMRKFYET